MFNFRMLTFIFALLLTSCGAIYTSPSVYKDDPNVEVIQLNSQVVRFANKSTYSPQRVPPIFNRVSAARNANSITQAALKPQRQAVESTAIVLPRYEPVVPYKLGVSDVVLLAIPTPNTATDLTGLIALQNKRQGYTVQDDGSIAVPDIGRIMIAGKTLEEAESEIFQVLVGNQIDPKFSLEIAEFNSKSVSVSGAVKEPQVIPIKLNALTLQNALQVAGGVDLSTPEYVTIKIFRDSKQYQVPLSEVLKNATVQKFRLNSGDVVILESQFQEDRAQAYVEEQIRLQQARKINFDIELARSEEARNNFLAKAELGAIKRDYVYLAGEVFKQARFEMPFGVRPSVADALYSEGGVKNKEANVANIYILRNSRSSDRIKAYHLNGSNAVNLLLATKMELRPNDVIFVSEQPVTVWNRIISQIIPSLSIINQVTN